MIFAFIVFAELGFWVFLGLGLWVRYVVRWPRLGMVLLLGVPLMDVVLLVATIWDLKSGAIAEDAHGVAALYLGITLVFGRSIIRWADERMAFKYANGSAPQKNSLSGWAHTRYEWMLWLKGVVACFIASVIVWLAILIVGDPERAQLLEEWPLSLAGMMLLWCVFGPLWYSLWPKPIPLKPSSKEID